MAVLVKSINGLAYAQIKSRNGLAVASISRIDGLDVTAGGPPSLISHIGGAFSNSGTTSGIDTTGATMLIVGCAIFHNQQMGITVTDSNSNTYTPLTQYYTPGTKAVQIFYCQGGTVGSGHTFTITTNSYSAMIFVQAWDGVGASPFDTENGSILDFGGSTFQPGSVSPSQSNSIVVSLESNVGDTVASIDSGFTALDNQGTGGWERGTMAYKVKTTSAAENPTWSNAFNNWAGANAVFKW